MRQRKTEAHWIESDQRWKIAVQIEGHRRQFYSNKRGRSGKIEAERLADRWLESEGSEGSRTFEQVYEIYLNSLQERQKRTGRGSAQYKKMESIGRIWVLPVIGRKKMDRLNNADYQKCIDSAYDTGRSRKTLLHISALLTGVYKTARKHRIQMERPEFLEIYEDAPSYPRDSARPSDISALFATEYQTERGQAVKCTHIHAFRIMCLLGLRRGEAAGLKWSDIHDNILHIQRSVNNLGEVTTGKTKAANRLIYLFPIAQEELEKQRTELKNLGVISPWVFPSPYTGRPDYDGLHRQWTIFCRSNGIENVTLHELRHTNISLAMGRISADLLRPVVGHTANMDTFGVYGHSTEDGLKEVAEKMQEIFSAVLNRK